jgi:predicted DNA-binding transcriptional regulator AlpA
VSDKKSIRMLAVSEVTNRTGLSKATIYRLERKGSFPMHVKLTPTRSAWAEHEIDAYLENLLALRQQPKPQRSRRGVSPV